MNRSLMPLLAQRRERPAPANFERSRSPHDHTRTKFGPASSLADGIPGRTAAGAWRDLGALVPDGHSEAFDVNDAGTVVGRSGAGPSPSQPAGAFMWDAAEGMRAVPGTAQPDPEPDPNQPYSQSFASAVSDSGIVAGGTSTPEGFLVPFVHDPASGETRVLPMPPDHPIASVTDVNDAGQVVGTAVYWGLAYTQAVLWSPPDYQPVVLPDPPGSGFSDQSAANAITEEGMIVGHWLEPGGDGMDGIAWEAAAPHTPREIEGFVPRDVGSDGTLVGDDGDYYDPVALVWRAGATRPERLGSLGGGAASAVAIDGRHIAGWATDGVDGPRHVARFAPNGR